MFIYNLFLNLLFFPIILVLSISSLFYYRLRITLFQRIFIKNIYFEKQPIWFHCSSLGEFNAVKNIILRLRQIYPYIFVTTLTNTGYTAAVSQLGKINVAILPLDFNFFIKKFIKKLNPKLLIIEETELWPNLVYQTYKKNIPILYTNAIMSEKSFRFYKRFNYIFRRLLESIYIFFVQNKETEKFLQYFKVNKNRIKYVGNIKFDMDLNYKIDVGSIKEKYHLNKKLIITCGSIRESEEEIFISAYRVLKEKFKNLKLVIVPRHLDRIQDIISMVKKNYLEYSLLTKIKKTFDVLIVDKMGVLLDFYAISDISYIGGTISPIGGHNPLEAAIFSKPIIFGKYINNNKEAFKSLLKNNGGIMIKDETELEKQLENLLIDSKQRKLIGRNAKSVVKKNQGAAQKITEYIIKNFIKK